MFGAEGVSRYSSNTQFRRSCRLPEPLIVYSFRAWLMAGGESGDPSWSSCFFIEKIGSSVLVLRCSKTMLLLVISWSLGLNLTFFWCSTCFHCILKHFFRIRPHSTFVKGRQGESFLTEKKWKTSLALSQIYCNPVFRRVDTPDGNEPEISLTHPFVGAQHLSRSESAGKRLSLVVLFGALCMP